MARTLLVLVWPTFLALAGGCGDPEVALQLEASEAKAVGLEQHVQALEQELAEARQEVEHLEDELAQAERDTLIEVSEVVERVDPHHAVVDAEKLSRYLTQLDSWGALGRMIPHRGPDGAVNGYRISGLRRGTLGQLMGLRNGDIVHEVDGIQLTSPKSAFRAYQALVDQESRLLDCAITRRGEPVTLRYTFASPERAPGELLGE